MNRMLRRPFHPDFHVLADLTLGSAKVIVDIGANVGESVEAIRLFQPAAPIVAFEPAAAAFDKLERSTRHLEGVTRHCMALGNRPGAFTLYTPVLKGVPLTPLASVDREEAAEWLGRFASPSLPASRLTVSEETVEIRTLDSYALAPSFVKIDVQGLERQVLEGGIETLRAHRPVIMAERGPGDGVTEFLADLDYTPYRREGGELRRSAEGENSIFLMREHHAALSCPVVA